MPTPTNRAWPAAVVLLVIVIGFMMFFIVTDQGSYVCMCKPKMGNDPAMWVKIPDIDGPCPPPGYEHLVCQ